MCIDGSRALRNARVYKSVLHPLPIQTQLAHVVTNDLDSSFVRVYSVASHDVKDRKVFHIDHTRSI